MLKVCVNGFKSAAPGLLNDVKQRTRTVSYTSRMLSELSELPKSVRQFVDESARICQPDNIKICNGTQEEYNMLLKQMQKDGVVRPLKKMNNW
jgi:GTP-dependent phosphoenolpyruvate carboxykinase